MRSVLLALLLVSATAQPLGAGDAITVLQERRARVPGKKPVVDHVALLKNTSSQSIRGLRVTVELYDTFGTLLWSRTVTPGPASLDPGETASLSVSTPDLAAYKKTVYRFDYRAVDRRRPQ